MLTLYRFYWDAGRMGEVSSLFVADSEVVERYIGYEVYFGEILGKHSQVYGVLEKDDLTAITQDETFIKKLLGMFDAKPDEWAPDSITLLGHNPIYTIQIREEEE